MLTEFNITSFTACPDFFAPELPNADSTRMEVLKSGPLLSLDSQEANNPEITTGRNHFIFLIKVFIIANFSNG